VGAQESGSMMEGQFIRKKAIAAIIIYHQSIGGLNFLLGRYCIEVSHSPGTRTERSWKGGGESRVVSVEAC